jgi:CelD/BcsL family acetyltransferase involved in cellulose biosynthesis
LTVSVLGDLAELERNRWDWEKLLATSGGHHPSLTPTWMITWWRVFGPDDGRRLRALAVRDGHALVGLLPLVARRTRYRRVIPMARLELVASGEDQVDEIHSEYLGPLAASGREAEVADALARYLEDQRDAWHEIVLPALDAEAPAVRALEPAFAGHGLTCASDVTATCPFIALPKRWDDYLGKLPADDRYMARRTLRDFEKWAGKGFRVEVARTHEDLARGKEILHRLHEHRWQAGGHDGAFASERFRRFHDMVMPALLDRDELDLRWLLVNGEPIAASYSVVRDGRVYYIQGGRSTSVPKGVRPGIALHLYTIRAAIEAGRREYDFLGGDARYKHQLATGTRRLVELRVTRPSLPETARTVLEAGREVYVMARATVRAMQAERAARSTPPEAAPEAARPETIRPEPAPGGGPSVGHAAAA